MRSGELNSYADVCAPNQHKTTAGEARDAAAEAIADRIVSEYDGDPVKAHLSCYQAFQGFEHDRETLCIARGLLFRRMDAPAKQFVNAYAVTRAVLDGITEDDLVIAAGARAVWEAHGRAARAARNAGVMQAAA